MPKGTQKKGGTRTQSSLILASLKNSHFYFGVFVRSVCDDREPCTHPQKAKFENNFVVFFFFFLKKCPPIDEWFPSSHRVPQYWCITTDEQHNDEVLTCTHKDANETLCIYAAIHQRESITRLGAQLRVGGRDGYISLIIIISIFHHFVRRAVSTNVDLFNLTDLADAQTPTRILFHYLHSLDVYYNREGGKWTLHSRIQRRNVVASYYKLRQTCVKKNKTKNNLMCVKEKKI